MKFIYQDTPIHIDILEDDTIDVIRYKLSQLLSSDVYLFGKKNVSYTSKQVYDRLIQTFGTIPQYHLRNFLLCFNEAVPILTKDEYTLEDLDAFSFEGLMDIPIGQIMPCATNPEKVVNLNNYNAITQEFRKLLLDYTPLFEDTVYVTCKKDIPLPLYFCPTIDSYQDISKVFTLPMTPPYKEGLTFLLCRLDTVEPLLVPLDVVFQQLHVSNAIQMIQYNSGKDILYKLYSLHEDLNGNKIPVLPLNEVIKQNQSYKHTVTVFFEDVKYAFHENGSILFEFESKQGLSLDEIDALFHRHDNFLEQIYSFMFTSGYVYPRFESIRETTILNMTYQMDFKVTNVTPHECSNLFLIDTGTSQRYRRVSMFYEGELIQEICAANYVKQIPKATTVRAITTIFHLNQVQAQQLVDNAYDTIAALVTDKKGITVKHKVGFTTTIVKTANNMTIAIENINSLQYVPSIHKNITAYVALLTVPNTIKCSNAPEEIPVVQNVLRRRYDSESESDSESDESLEIEFEGGGNDPDLVVNNPHFTVYRMKLFNHAYNGYTRACPLQRRPIALINEEEIQKARVRNMNMYTYKTVPYICPMYWDIENKTPLTQQEVDVLVLQGKKIIDKDRKGEINPRLHGSILQMNDGKSPYPGPLDEGVCCFKAPPKDKPDVRNAIESKQYINHNPTSLAEEGKVSYVPKSLRFLFQLTDKCELEPNNYLLRYGIAFPHTFLQCIETCFNVTYPTKKNHAIFIDSILKVAEKKFATLQNSNLIRHYTTFDAFRREFLKEKMDYTELWDIISDFMSVNLVILRVPDDIHVEFICPMRTIDNKKVMLILLEQTVKNVVCFEPLIEHTVDKNTHSVLHLYYHAKLHNAFEQIESIYLKCTHQSEQYSTNFIASLVYSFLPPKTSQIIHSNKCIGFSVNDVFIPCYPSAPLPIHDTFLPVSSYEHTFNVLEQYAVHLPCKPRYKVVNRVLTGIMTESNSFVPCQPTLPTVSPLPIYPHLVNHEYMDIPKQVNTTLIHKTLVSKAEKYLYKAFRRYLKEKMRKHALRKLLKSAISKKEVGIDLLKRIIKVQWIEDVDDFYLHQLIKCKGYCSMTDTLLLPKMNLKTGVPNDYFARLANELNHYNRISTFILKPQLQMSMIPFYVEQHEVILTQSVLEDYYDALTEPKRVPSNYDNANLKIQLKLFFKVKKLHYITI